MIEMQVRMSILRMGIEKNLMILFQIPVFLNDSCYKHLGDSIKGSFSTLAEFARIFLGVPGKLLRSLTSEL